MLGPLREQAPCMAMGQAAGTAASLVPAGAGFADVEVPALRQRLRDQGASSTTPQPGTTTPDPLGGRPARAPRVMGLVRVRAGPDVVDTSSGNVLSKRPWHGGIGW